MRFRLTPRSMTLDDLELYKFEFSCAAILFNKTMCVYMQFLGISQISDATTAKRMKIDQYCQRQRCIKHVELEQFLACFRVALICQRHLGFLVNFANAIERL